MEAFTISLSIIIWFGPMIGAVIYAQRRIDMEYRLKEWIHQKFIFILKNMEKAEKKDKELLIMVYENLRDRYKKVLLDWKKETNLDERINMLNVFLYSISALQRIYFLLEKDTT